MNNPPKDAESRRTARRAAEAQAIAQLDADWAELDTAKAAGWDLEL